MICLLLELLAQIIVEQAVTHQLMVVLVVLSDKRLATCLRDHLADNRAKVLLLMLEEILSLPLHLVE